MCCFEYCFSILFRTYSNESILSDATTVRNNYSITDENEKIVYYNNPLLEKNYKKELFNINSIYIFILNAFFKL